MMNKEIELDVLVGDKPIRQYFHDGKWFIEAREGQEYSLRIKNNTSNRLLVVGSIDGLNYLDGKIASKNDTGYICEPYRSLTVKGYRANLSEVGAFKFVKKTESYLASKGLGVWNCGIIGISIFKEKVKPVTYSWGSLGATLTGVTWTFNGGATNYFDSPCISGCLSVNNITLDCSATVSSATNFMTNCSDTLRSATSTSYSAAAPKTTFNLGSTWGTKLEDRVVETEFIRDDNVYVVMEIFYDTLAGLEAQGVDVKPVKNVSFPSSFPADSKFCVPPVNWSK